MGVPLSSNLAWQTANPLWAAALNPLIANPTNSIQLLQNVSLSSGKNVIPHGLGRQMIGWFLGDIQGAQTVYRSAPFNSTTLTLTASGAVVINIGVF